MADIGQKPVLLNRAVDGFALNRIQPCFILTLSLLIFVFYALIVRTLFKNVLYSKFKNNLFQIEH